MLVLLVVLPLALLPAYALTAWKMARPVLQTQTVSPIARTVIALTARWIKRGVRQTQTVRPGNAISAHQYSAYPMQIAKAASATLLHLLIKTIVFQAAATGRRIDA